MAQVRVREHEKGTPLYVLCRKWVQNDPDTELMPPKDRSVEGAVKEPVVKLPPVAPASEEEDALAEQAPPTEPELPESQRDPPTLEVTL